MNQQIISRPPSIGLVISAVAAVSAAALLAIYTPLRESAVIILFIPLMTLYGLTYVHLGLLVGINFTTQVLVDIIASRLVDRFGFRVFVLPADLLAVVGLVLFALSPVLFGNVLVGLILATIIFSASCGLQEVMLSPIVNAIPHDDKGPAMALMHSFYAWGQVATIVITTLFLFFFGIRSLLLFQLSGKYYSCHWNTGRVQYLHVCQLYVFHANVAIQIQVGNVYLDKLP